VVEERAERIDLENKIDVFLGICEKTKQKAPRSVGVVANGGVGCSLGDRNGK
jgi:hypothetical protein